MAAIPDIWVTVEDWVVAGDRLACAWTAGGTNTGELMGMPPTGRQASCSGIHLCHVRDGRIAETWTRWDTLGLLQQLGLVQLGQQAVA
jgi:predicted ester cyclase